MTLLVTEDEAVDSPEIAQLLAEVRKLDIKKADDYEELVRSQTRRK